jgi:hypothetical protein
MVKCINLNCSKYIFKLVTKIVALLAILPLFYYVTDSKTLIKFQYIDELCNNAFNNSVIDFKVGYMLLIDFCYYINFTVI